MVEREYWYLRFAADTEVRLPANPEQYFISAEAADLARQEQALPDYWDIIQELRFPVLRLMAPAMVSPGVGHD